MRGVCLGLGTGASGRVLKDELMGMRGERESGKPVVGLKGYWRGGVEVYQDCQQDYCQSQDY